MIEGEEIFESASETGYRLCTSEQDIDNSIFSASWDKNDPRRMFICSQNGQLRVINTEDAGILKYEVIFKRYTTYDNTMNEPEKVIHDHWDRMVTIPDRPNEIIFLLGMSKSLYYTALPGSDSTASTNANYPKDTSVVITSATRANFPGYLYGTPVMEISGHAGRIVSMAVSPAGHVLASGDELGNVRLLLLQLLDELSIIRKKEQRKRRHVVERQFNTFQKSYNTTQRVHDHSVFSLEWLPLIQTRDDVRYYGLVTGSQDSAVRIWTVTCCSKAGLTMTPCQSLNTMSTGVLCLTSYLLVDRQLEIVLARQLERAKEQGRDDRHRDPFLPTKSHSSAREQHELNNAKSVYLAAGTDKGTIYVWKLHFHSIQKQLLVAAGVVVKDVPPVDVYSAESEEDEDEEEGTRVIQDPFSDAVTIRVAKPRPVTPKFTSFAIDDGTALHSLMQTSDCPIIHVSVTSNGSQNVSSLEQLVSNRTVDTSRLSSSDTVLLAASDTNGVARLHTVDLTATSDARGAQEFFLRLSKNEQAMQVSAENTISRIKASLHRGQAGSQLERQIGSLGGLHSGDGGASSGGLVNNNKPLVPASSTMQFSSAVVACAFQALSVPGAEEIRSANNSGTNTPMSAMSPSHTRFNATSNQSSPAGSVSSGRGGNYGLSYSMLSLTARTPSLAVVCAEGLIKLFASENMQTLLNGELGMHDPAVDHLTTAPSSTTASSPATSESSVPAPIIHTNSSRRSRTNSAAGSAGNVSTASPNSKGSRSNVLFASPAAAGGSSVSPKGVEREADSEIEARVSPIPRIQQQQRGSGQTATRPAVVRVDGASSQNIAASSSSKVRSAPRLDKIVAAKAPSAAPSVAAAVPKVLNVGGGVMFKTNVTSAPAIVPNTSSKIIAPREFEDDSLSFPHRAGASSSSGFKSVSTSTAGNKTTTTTTTSSSSSSSAKTGSRTVTHRSVALEEDDSSVEPRQPLSATSRLQTQRAPQPTAVSVSRPSTAPVTATTSTAQSQSKQPQSGGGEWTYERMSTQYQNDFAMAAFNSVAIQRQQLARLQDDEVTVSTLHTTESDHRAAARATVRNQPLGDNRYSFLTSATSTGEASRNKGAQRLAKQTDPSYLARKQHGGPSEDDLKVLRPRDPLVDRQLRFTPSTPLSIGMRRPAAVSSSGKSRNVWDSVDTGVGTAATAATSAAQNNTYRYNSEFGLYCEMDKTTLQPKFRMEVNADEILGRVDITRSMQLGRRAVERMREDHMFSLISATIV